MDNQLLIARSHPCEPSPAKDSKMNIPVDEMLTELREALEQFDREPTLANFDRLLNETTRIERTCEEQIP